MCGSLPSCNDPQSFINLSPYRVTGRFNDKTCRLKSWNTRTNLMTTLETVIVVARGSNTLFRQRIVTPTGAFMTCSKSIGIHMELVPSLQQLHSSSRLWIVSVGISAPSSRRYLWDTDAGPEDSDSSSVMGLSSGLCGARPALQHNAPGRAFMDLSPGTQHFPKQSWNHRTVWSSKI